MNKKLLAFISALFLLIPGIALAVPSSVDRITNHIEPLIKTDFIRAPFFTATSTTATSTFPTASSTTICLSSDCRTVWPVFSGGSGTVSTSSKETLGYFPAWTTTNGSPALLSGTSTLFQLNGNIGIATTTPSSPLTVSGNSWLGGTSTHMGTTNCTLGLTGNGALGAELCGNTAIAGGWILNIENDSPSNLAFSGVNFANDVSSSAFTFAGIFFNSSTYNYTGYGTALAIPSNFSIENTQGNVSFITATTSPSSAYFNWLTLGANTGNEVMRLTATGNLGIGTTAPSTLLHVYGNVAGGVALFERTNATTNQAVGTVKIKATSSGTPADGFGAAFQFYQQGSNGVENYLADIRGLRSGADNSGALTFSTSNAGVTSEVARFTPAGRFGLGSTTPGARFSIHDNSGGIATSTLEFSIASSTAAGLSTTTLFSVNGVGSTTIAGSVAITGGLMNDNNGRINLGIGVSGTNKPKCGLAIMDNFAASCSVATGALIGANLSNDTNFAAYKVASFQKGSNVNGLTTAGGNAMFYAAQVNTQTNDTAGFWNQTQTTNQINTATSYGYVSMNYMQGTGQLGNYIGYFSRGTFATAGPTVTNQYDFRASPFLNLANGTTTNRYGLYLDYDNTSITNAYGVYQVSTAVKNYFAGNVGFGTTSPAARVAIAGGVGSTTDLFVIASSSNTQYVTVKSDGKMGLGTTSPSGLLSIKGVGTGTGINFQTTDSSNNAILTSLDNGFVGIGTINPLAPLVVHVASGQNFVARTTGPKLQLAGMVDDLNSYMAVGIDGSSITLGVNSGANVGIGTSTPASRLDIYGTAGTGDIFSVSSSSNARLFTIKNTGAVGIGSSSPSGTALTTNGTVYMTGLTTSAGLQSGVACFDANGQVINDSVACLASARRFKQEISPLSSTESLDEILRLNPSSYFYKTDFNGALQSDPNYSRMQIGLIADDVQKIDPGFAIVTTGTSTFEGKEYPVGTIKGIDYNAITARLVGAVQAQQEQINALGGAAKKSMENNWQWGAIGLLALLLVRQQFQINRIKKLYD